MQHSPSPLKKEIASEMSVSNLINYFKYQINNPFISEPDKENIRQATSIIRSALSSFDGTENLVYGKNPGFILSTREKEVVHWTSTGKTYHEVATILQISESIIKYHMKNVIKKLGASNSKQAIRRAVELQIIEGMAM